jgi:putative ABC transport system permease protein
LRLRPRWQKVFSDLAGNRIRSLLVLASIAVGLFALGVIANIYLVALADMQRGYAAVNPANIHISASLLPQGLVNHIAEVSGVRQAEGERTFNLRLSTSPDEWTAIELHAWKDPGELQINQLRLVEGAWPPGEGEIVFDGYKLSQTNASLGDIVVLELPSGKTRSLRLVGVVQDQTIGAFGGAGGFFNAPVQGYLNRDTLDELEQTQSKLYNQLNLTVAGDSADPSYRDGVAQLVRDELERNNVQIISMASRSSTEHPNLFLSQAILAVLVVIGLLVVFLSSFLITNTLQAIMNQQMVQIGILKTIGGRRLQITGIYLMLSLLYGVIAFLVALPLANQVAFLIINILTDEMNYTFYGERFVPEVAILQAVIAVLMPVLAALAPVWQGARISVQEALSGYRQDHPPDQGWLDQRVSRLRDFSLMLLISLRNTFRHKVRLGLTLLTLTLGGALFIATFNVRVSMLDYVDQIIRYFLADINITLARSYRIEEIEGLLNEVSAVESVEGWMFARSELVLDDGSVGESVTLLAPPADSHLIEPILLDGRWVVPGDRNAIALSELFKERFPDLRVGDTLQLRVNGEETDWVVVGFFQLAGKVSGLSAYTHYEYLAELVHQSGRSASYRVASNLVTPTPDEQEALGRTIEAHLERAGIQVADVETGLALTETASEGFNILTGFLLFLAILTALVGSIGLAGVMSLNVMERTREIGILRAVGASDRMLLRMVLIEGALIGMLSWVLASLAAFPISQLMSDSISQALFGGASSFGFTLTGFVIWLVVVTLLSILASVIPARSAARVTIREVLSYE